MIRSKEAERKRQKLYLKYLIEGRVYKISISKNQSQNISQRKLLFLTMDEKRQQQKKDLLSSEKSHQYFHPTLFSEL